jgi:MtfA peptidase
MPDTIYYKDGTIVPFDSLSTEAQTILQQIPAENTRVPKDSDNYAAYVWLSVILIGFVAVRRALREKGTTLLKGSYDSNKTLNTSDKIGDILKEYHVYHGRDLEITDEQYDKILGKRFPYYRRLASGLKEKFVHRTKRFLSDKTFLIKDDEPFLEMPVLISATAVQLTFGLEKYVLPHYEYIRIYPQEYFGKGSLKVLAGHVYGNTITIAWNHFLKGHEEYTDGINLGLHEMAHALYFQLVEADIGRCNRFSNIFNHILAEGMEVHEMKHTCPSQLYKENAYRNLQEFWAETVEIFFERPGELQRENAELYNLVKDILSQDTVNTMFPVTEV